ncbi:MAG: cysteine desulfurase NifS [bacterium]|nr:cysteine desulfurase NifS [bacterium]
MKRIYLDYAATTPIHPEVLSEMIRYMQFDFGNPSSVHSFGREARAAVDNARKTVALAIGAQMSEIVFTSGATEADNLAIQGVAIAKQKKGKHIITTQIEHHAVIDACKHLEKNGFEVTYLPVNEFGEVSVTDLEKAIRQDTILISVMHANNEMGTIQPIDEIGKIAKSKGIVFHTDAVQTIGNILVDVQKLNVDLLSLSGHKIYGPKGIGALYIRKGTVIRPIVFGGSQERKFRPGTENVPGIVGLAKAISIATNELEKNAAHLRLLRDRLIEGLLAIPEIILNGHPVNRLPGNANVSVRYVEGESLIVSVEMKGVAVASGSACTSGSLEPSHVMLALGLSHEVAHGSLRFSMGRETTMEEIEYVVGIMPEIVNRLRQMSPLYEG